MSDGYEIEELTRIETAIDALESPTSEDVFQATRPFDERAIASVAAKRAGDGSGGSQPFLTATVTLGNEDIKALPTTPFEVVPAPGAAKIICPVYAVALLDATGGAYNSDPGRSWQLFVGNERSGMLEPNSVLVAAAAHFFLFPPLSFIGAGDFVGYLTGGQGQDLANLIDAALTIGDVYNGVADYTGGNAANTLKVTVSYLVADV